MKLIAQTKLKNTPEQHDVLKRTLETVNQAANYISGYAWQTGIFRQYDLHQKLYYELREKFDLSAQVTVRVLAKVADAYKLDRRTKRIFKPLGSIAYDERILSWRLPDQTLNIWTVEGRQRIPFAAGPRQLELLKSMQGQADLVYRDGAFYVHQVCEVEEPPEGDVDEFLGVDLGIKNIATDSDGEKFAGGHLNGLRARHARLRYKLQKKGTKSTRHLLKKRYRKEQRMAKDANHRISKRLVKKAKDTGRGIALEDLKGIRGRVTVHKGQRRQLHSWSFFDLRTKIGYKARLAGVLVILVDPRNTSRICPICGCIDKRNRPDQETFSCTSCGYSANADTNAARNIASRATRQPATHLGCADYRAAPGISLPVSAVGS